MNDYEKFQAGVFQQIREMELIEEQAKSQWGELVWGLCVRLCAEVGWDARNLPREDPKIGYVVGDAMDFIRRSVERRLGLAPDTGVDWKRGLRWAQDAGLRGAL